MIVDRFDENRINEHLALASKTSQRIWNPQIEYSHISGSLMAEIKFQSLSGDFREDVERFAVADRYFVAAALNNYVYALEEIQHLRSYIALLESERESEEEE